MNRTENFSLLDFQLLAIEQKDQHEVFVEKHDFRNSQRQQARAALQPKDIGWSPSEGTRERN